MYETNVAAAVLPPPSSFPHYLVDDALRERWAVAWRHSTGVLPGVCAHHTRAHHTPVIAKQTQSLAGARRPRLRRATPRTRIRASAAACAAFCCFPEFRFRRPSLLRRLRPPSAVSTPASRLRRSVHRRRPPSAGTSADPECDKNPSRLLLFSSEHLRRRCAAFTVTPAT